MSLGTMGHSMSGLLKIYIHSFPKRMYINNPNLYEKVIVKTTGASLKHGSWKIYDPYTGQKLRTENWILDVLQDPNAKKEDPADTSSVLPNRGTPKAKSDTATKKIIPKEKSSPITDPNTK